MMISHATNDRNLQRHKPNKVMLQRIAQTVSMFGGQESGALLEQMYAKEIAVDYTSQLGGDRSDSTLMAKWAANLLGFDHTRYTISDVSLNLQMQGTQLMAEVRIGADRWVDDLFLEIEKTYHHQVDSGLRSSQVLSRTLQALTDTGVWEEKEHIEVVTPKEIVRHFFSELRLNNIEKASQWIAEDAIFTLSGKTFHSGELQGRREIVHFLFELHEQQDSFMKIQGEDLCSILERDAIFFQWQGGAGCVTVKDQRISKLQTYLG